MKVNPAPSTATEVTLRVVSEEDAARYLGISRSSLRKGRMQGRRATMMSSPPFVKIGRRVGYLIEDLEAWLRQCRHDNDFVSGAR
ncbi:MAG: helix-turn-helix domain-containing protein [Burkholderiales bacterium]|nr:helix-turn-helix domain-containing protein [Burkholderiales bacterium]